MAKNGLDKWFKQKWVDIGSKKKGGGHKPCGRKSARGSKRKYPKCVPAAKAARMTASQKRSAVARKKAFSGGYMGRSIRGEYGGVNLSNPSYVKYYKGMLD